MVTNSVGPRILAGALIVITAVGITSCGSKKQEADKPAVAEMLVELASEMFFEQLKQRCSPPDVDNIRGYLLDCEFLINGNPLERDF